MTEPMKGPVRGVWGVRYQVADVERAVDFYTRHLGFTLDAKHPPAFAQVSVGGSKLVLSGPGASGSRAMPDGRRQEPVVLPVKVPVVLMLGTEGIAVGMSTRILPHNFCELLKAQIAILRGNPAKVRPDFLQGGGKWRTREDILDKSLAKTAAKIAGNVRAAGARQP